MQMPGEKKNRFNFAAAHARMGGVFRRLRIWGTRIVPFSRLAGLGTGFWTSSLATRLLICENSTGKAVLFDMSLNSLSKRRALFEEGRKNRTLMGMATLGGMAILFFV